MSKLLTILDQKPYLQNIFSNYNIGFCSRGEIDEVIEFIDQFWKKDHIFVKSRALMDWMYLDRRRNRYNWVVARDKKTNRLDGILGFILYDRFDQSLGDSILIPAIWKIRDGVALHGLGTSLYYFLKENIITKTILMLGISERALSMYKNWGFHSGNMDHYFLIHPNKTTFQLLQCTQNQPRNSGAASDPGKRLQIMDRAAYDALPQQVFVFSGLCRTRNYYVSRYFEHPVYKYLFYLITNQDQPIGVVVCRECEHNGQKALRVVDYIGRKEALLGLLFEWNRLLQESGYEYIDFLVGGFAEQVLYCSGFLRKSDFEGLVIPDHYEPFELRNIELDYTYLTVDKECDFVIYKGDGDQDRPNAFLDNIRYG